MPAKTGERVVSAEVLTTRSPVLSELDWYQLRKALRGYSRKSIQETWSVLRGSSTVGA